MISINEQTYTEQDFSDIANQFMAVAARHNLANKIVAVCTQDLALWLGVCLAVKKIGFCSLLPLHVDLPKEVAFEKAQSAGASLLIWQSLDCCTAFNEKLESKAVLNLEKSRGSEVEGNRDAGENGKDRQHRRPLGLIQYSSGTTGEPKIILRSWSDIEFEISSYNRLLALPDGCTTVVACPITHSYGLISGVLSCIARNSDLHIISKQNPKLLSDILGVYPSYILYSSPYYIEATIQTLEEGEVLDRVMTSGSTLSQEQFNFISNKAQHLYQQYGCSEFGCISIAKQSELANCIGKALDRFFLEAGESLDQAKPLGVKKRDCKDKDLQSTSFLYTGDLAYFSEKNELMFLARQDDTAIIAGQNVYPSDVEQALLSRPEIIDCVAFKIEVESGHKLCLLYSSHEEIQTAQLRRWCSENLARFQWPSYFIACNVIPRMENGKVNRRSLAELYRPQLNTQSSTLLNRGRNGLKAKEFDHA